MSKGLSGLGLGIMWVSAVLGFVFAPEWFGAGFAGERAAWGILVGVVAYGVFAFATLGVVYVREGKHHE